MSSVYCSNHNEVLFALASHNLLRVKLLSKSISMHLCLTLDSLIPVHDVDVDLSHVGGEEAAETVSPSAWQAVEGISHWLAVRVLAITHSAIRSRVVACAHQVLVHTVLLVVAHHHEQFGAQTRGQSLGNQHVLEDKE